MKKIDLKGHWSSPCPFFTPLKTIFFLCFLMLNIQLQAENSSNLETGLPSSESAESLVLAGATFTATSAIVDLSAGAQTITFNVPAAGVECITGGIGLVLEIDGNFNGNNTNEEITIVGTGVPSQSYNEDGDNCDGVFTVAHTPALSVGIGDASEFECKESGDTYTFLLTAGSAASAVCAQARLTLSFNYETYEDPVITCPADVTIECGDPTTSGGGALPGTAMASNTTFTAIPDDDPLGISTSATISGIPPGAIIDDIRVTGIELDHTWIGDLFIELQASTGETLVLMDRPGSPPSTFGNQVLFDPSGPINFDETAGTFADNMGDLLGSADIVCFTDGICDFRPHDGSVTFNDLIADLVTNSSDPNQVWSLFVSDNAGGDTGNLHEWTLEIDYTTTGGTGIASATDNCNVASITESDGTMSDLCGDTGEFTRLWTATDDCDNTHTCEQTITIEDTTGPDITCPADVTVECGMDETSASNGMATATDDCSAVADITIGESDGTKSDLCASTGIYDRTWTATDDCGEMSSCDQQITVVDTTDPVITCPADVTVECGMDETSASNGMATATDNCSAAGDITIDESDGTMSDLCASTGIYDRTWTATDECGEMSSCDQQITVVDTTDPVITCPADVTVECGMDETSASNGMATATDNCSATGDITIGESDGSMSDLCASTGVYDRTWTATDECGEMSSCDQQITVVDTTDPVITCPADVTVECGMDETSASNGMATATDNCSAAGDITIGESDGTMSDLCASTGIYDRTWTATDECGEMSSCDQQITVVDTTDPVITCPNDVTVECGMDETSASNGMATATDNCSAVVDITIGESDGTMSDLCANTGVYDRTWTATDECGEMSSCDQQITVVDTTDPVITCPADVTVECGMDDTSAATGMATATDNCSAALDITIGESDVLAGDCGMTGVITRTWTATDECGEMSSCDQEITIEDNTAPTITTAAMDLTVECDGAGNTQDLAFWLEENTGASQIFLSTGSSTGDIYNGDIYAASPLNTLYTGTSYNARSIVYNRNNEYIYASNSHSGVLRYAADGSEETLLISGTDAIDLTLDIANDKIYVVGHNIISMNMDGTGETTINTSLDNHGAIVYDPINDQLIVSQDEEIYTLDTDGTNQQLMHSTSLDNIRSLKVDITNQKLIIGARYSTGIHVANLDGTGSVTQLYPTTMDNVKLDIQNDIIYYKEGLTQVYSAPVDGSGPQTLLYTGSGFRGIAVGGYVNSPTQLTAATDDCGTVSWDNNFTELSDLCGETGSATVEFYVTDECGNTSTTTATFTIEDTTPPDWTAPADFNGFASTTDCNLQVPFAIPAITEDCGPASFTSVTADNFVTIFPIAGVWQATYPVGVTTVTATATDDCGNPNTQSFTVTITDPHLPSTLNCPAAITTGTDAGVCTSEESWTNPNAIDNCNIVNFTTSYSDGSGGSNTPADYPDPISYTGTGSDGGQPMTETFFKGETLVTFSFTDENNNNTGTCTMLVTVNDDEFPVFDTPPGATTLECADDIPATASLSWTDNCDGSGSVMSTDGALVGGACGGTITRSWTYTDICGPNTTTVTQVFTIDDTMAPAVTGSLDDDTVEGCSYTDIPAAYTMVSQLEAAMGDLDIMDNCSDDANLTVDVSDDGGIGTCPVVVTRTYTVTDECDNTSSTFTHVININDTTSPVFDAPPAAVTVECFDDVPVMTSLGWTDACDGSSSVMGSDAALVGDGCGGTVTRTWSYTDACGNPASATQTITVDDTTSPVITGALDDDTVEGCGLADLPAAFTTVAELEGADGTADITDNCLDDADLEVSVSDDGGIGTCPIVVTRTYTVSDTCDNSAMITHIINIEDTTDPTIDQAPGSADALLECSDAASLADTLAFMPTGMDNCGSTTATLVSDDSFESVTTVVGGGSTGPIPDNDPIGADFTLNVAGLGTVITDVNLPIEISHTWVADLTVVLTSPSNTSVTLISGVCGNNNDAVLAVDATFDDEGTTIQCEPTDMNVIGVGPAVGPGAMSDFIGEDPNGLWTLNVVDGANGDTGSVDLWSLEISALVPLSGPGSGPHSMCATDTPLAIPDNTTAGVSSTITFSGLDPEIADVNVPIDITHTWTGDLDITLTSPEGTILDLFSDNCGSSSNDNLNVIFDDEGVALDCGVNHESGLNVMPDPTDDALDAFDGENPNGTWTLFIADDASGDLGDLNSWCLDIETVPPPPSCGDLRIRTWDIVDGCGNDVQFTQTIEFEDTTAPEFDQLAGSEDVTLECDDATGIADALAFAPTASDNCSLPSIALSSDDTVPDLTCPNAYVQTRVWEAEDDCGNVLTFTQVITVEDNVAPVMTNFPSDIVLNTTTTDCNQDVFIQKPDVTDSCPGMVSLTIEADNPSVNFGDLGTQWNGDFPEGMTTVTITATDICGNTSTDQLMVDIVDNVPPVVIGVCPTSIALDTELDACAASHTWTTPGFDDNCLLSSMEIKFSSDVSDPVSGPLPTDIMYTFPQSQGGQTETESFPEGTTNVEYMLTDETGNTAVYCSFSVVVTDNQMPDVVCDNSTVVTLDATGNGSIVPTDVDGGSSDNCGIMTTTASPLTFDCSTLGSQDVVLTITDVNGNMNSSTCTLMVEDSETPVAVCPASIADVELDSGGNGTLPADIGDGSSTDNCTATESSLSSTYDCSDVGVQSVTLMVSDASGNTSSISCSFNVVDNIDPVAMCPVSIADVTLNFVGNGTLPANIGDGSSIDNCEATESSLSSSYDCSDLGVQMVTLIATDASGNTNSISCSFNVVDNELPEAICPASIADVVLDGSGNGTLPANIGDGSSTDNCNANLVETSPSASYTCADAGSQTVLLTVTDGSNSSSVSCTFMVVDNELPVAVCPASIADVELNASGSGMLPLNSVGDGSSTDNCGASESNPPLSLDCSNLGANTVVLRVTDPSGNTGTALCSFNVVDNIDPVAVCPTAIADVELDASGNGTLPADIGDGSSTDNCGYTEMSPSMTYDCDDLGAQSVILTVTDDSGNSSTTSCSFNVVDNIDPVWDMGSLPPDQVLSANSSDCNQDAFIFKPTATDNCDATVSFTIVADDPSVNFGDLGTLWNADFPVGVTTVTITGTDNVGNMITHVLTITVNDVTPPLFTTGCPADLEVMSDVTNSINLCTSEYTFNVPNVIDACGIMGVDVLFSDGAPVPSHLPDDIINSAPAANHTLRFGEGATVITFEATDLNGLVSTCSFTLTSVCPDCYDTLYVSQAMIDAASLGEVFSANMNVNSDADVKLGQDVMFSAPEIDLTPEFDVELGGLFETSSQTCSSLLPRALSNTIETLNDKQSESNDDKEINTSKGIKEESLNDTDLKNEIKGIK